MNHGYGNCAGIVGTTAVAFLVAGCGGGSSSTTTVTSPTTTDGAARVKAGSFNTDVVYEGSGSDSGLTFLSPSGQFTTVFGPSDVSFGSLSFDNGNISGSGTDFIRRNSVWKQTQGQISGKVETESLATLEGTSPDLTSAITLTRQNAFSNQAISLSGISNTYTMTDDGGVVEAQVTVDPSGQVHGEAGTATSDCILNGQLTIPDPTVNIFEIKYTATGCADGETGSATERNGDFFSIDTFDQEAGEVQFAANNGTIATLFIGTR